MSWSFETDSEFQAQLDWIDTFTRDEIEPLDLLGDRSAPEGSGRRGRRQARS